MSTSRTARHRSNKAALVCALLLAASPLAAGDSRWYLAGKLGQASVNADFGPRILGWRVDGEEPAASVELGYTIHRHFALQAGYHDLGDYAGQPLPCPRGEVCPATFAPSLVPVFPVESGFTGLSLAAVPRWPVNDRIWVYGKLGLLEWEGDPSPQFDGQQIERPSGTDVMAGVGAQYVFRKGLGVLLEYERAELFDGVSLGTSWRF